jgi:dolichyl-phosphate beta-glucosyltransferase
MATPNRQGNVLFDCLLHIRVLLVHQCGFKPMRNEKISKKHTQRQSMFTSFIEQTLLLLLLIGLVAAALVFLFYPALVDRQSDASPRPTPVILHSTVVVVDHKSTTTPPPLLSIIIPAYEEEERLPRMLLDAYTYLNSPNCCALVDLASLRKETSSTAPPPLVEWIVVNDGSKDNTSQSYQKFIDKHVATTSTSSSNANASNATVTTAVPFSVWKLVVFERNRGKGAAVRTGMLAATGDFCLMVDADGATDFGPGLTAVTQRLVAATLQAKLDISVPPLYPILLGSRAHLQESNAATATTNGDQASLGESIPRSSSSSGGRSLLRGLLMHVFHVCVVILIGAHNVKDTQCGFKLFHRTAATRLFRHLHLQRWAFDTELLFLATRWQYELLEVDVAWHDVEGSKLHTSALNLALVSICMLRDMACVRLCYTLGLWKIRRKQD